MEKEFDDFVEKHFDQFGAFSPSPGIWQNMEKRLIEYHSVKRRKAMVRLLVTLSTAAAACLLAAVLIVHYRNEGSQAKTEFVTGAPDSSQKQTDTSDSDDLASTPATIALPAEYSMRINHYRMSIEEKQRRLDSLRKKDPELYKSFKNASEALKLLYRRLQAKLPVSPDRGRILQLMIENLKIQENALNNQLELLMNPGSTDNNHQKSAFQ